MELHEFKLSKKDFRDIRELLSVALEREFVLGLQQVEASIAQWRREKPGSSREHYHELLKGLKEHRKQLAHTYEDNNKLGMEMSIVRLLFEAILTEKDLEIMQPECREYFAASLKRMG